MPGMTGIEATRLLLEQSPDSAVLMLTISHDDGAGLDAILAGASGYLLKDAQLPEIVRGIRAAAAGQALIAPEVAGDLLAQLREHGPARSTGGRSGALRTRARVLLSSSPAAD